MNILQANEQRTRRCLEEEMNVWTRCSTRSLTCFPLNDVETESVESLPDVLAVGKRSRFNRMGFVSLLVVVVVVRSCFDALSKRSVIDDVEQGKEIVSGVLAAREAVMPFDRRVHVRLTYYYSQCYPVRPNHQDRYHCHRSSSVQMKPPVEGVRLERLFALMY